MHHTAETDSVLLAIGTLLNEKNLWNLNKLQMSYLGAEKNTLTLMFFLNNRLTFSAAYLRKEKTICIYLPGEERPKYTIVPLQPPQEHRKEIKELLTLCVKQGNNFIVNDFTLPCDIYLAGQSVPVGNIIKAHDTLTLRLGDNQNGYRTLSSVPLTKR
jgi:hypothetical protein